MVGRTTWRHIRIWAGQHRDRFGGGQGKAEADSAVGRTTHRQIRQLTGKRGDRFGCGQDNGMQIWQWAGQRGGRLGGGQDNVEAELTTFLLVKSQLSQIL